MAELIEMPFGRLTYVRPRNHVLGWGRDLMNPFAATRGDKMAMWPISKWLRTLKLWVLKVHHTVAVNMMFMCHCQGPFATFKMQQDKDCDWTGLKFSPDGKLILISTNGQVIRLIDAFQGTPLQTFMVSTIAVILNDKVQYLGFNSLQFGC